MTHVMNIFMRVQFYQVIKFGLWTSLCVYKFSMEESQEMELNSQTCKGVHD